MIAISAVIKNKTRKNDVAAKSTVKPITPLMAAVIASMSINIFITFIYVQNWLQNLHIQVNTPTITK
jgi:hypothetical protein